MTLRSAAILFSFGALALHGCGGIGLGTSKGASEPVPDGTLLKSGTFSGLNGKTVTGQAEIYKLNSTGVYVVRLNGLDAPADAGLKVEAKSASATVLSTSLRSNTGSTNYSTGNADPSVNFVQVTIFSSVENKDFGAASLH